MGKFSYHRGYCLGYFNSRRSETSWLLNVFKVLFMSANYLSQFLSYKIAIKIKRFRKPYQVLLYLRLQETTLFHCFQGTCKILGPRHSGTILQHSYFPHPPGVLLPKTRGQGRSEQTWGGRVVGLQTVGAGEGGPDHPIGSFSYTDYQGRLSYTKIYIMFYSSQWMVW